MVMNRALIGKEYTSKDRFVVTAEAARAYALATNATFSAYEGQNAIAPPMFGVAFTLSALGMPMFDPELGANMMRLVHGDQDMRFLAAVKPGDVISATSKIENIVDKTMGEVITIGITAKNQRGASVLQASSGLFIRGARKKENIAAERAERDAEEAEWEVATPAWSSTVTVAADQSVRYADASGDRNPIHLDPEVAKMAGLPAIILHGLCTMAFVHNSCVRQAGNDPLRVKRLAVRFNRPVLMGDVLTIDARGAATGPWNIRVKNDSNVVVLKSGLAEIA